MPKTFYITTAIDYTNSAPHIGHAYEKILADVIARYHRLKCDEVFFLTGVDQHGQKVQQSAAKEGVAPAEFVKGVTQKSVDLWKKLDVKYDRWAATTDPLHKKCVQGILQRLWNEKKIYKDKQAGYYSIRQEQFLTDKERGANGEFGAEWGEVEFREEENYYFKLSEYKEWLLGYLQKHPDCVTPSFRQTELINAVAKISGDLCISRPKSRLDWGIELPFDKDFVNYVWFDALTNYISFIGYDPSRSTINDQPSTFLEKWPALQIIGKDILIPAHGIYWMIMLRALGFPDEAMPKFLVHGWWNISGSKMSKSAGNVVDPNTLADKYGAEALRYYLMNEIATGKDADFSEGHVVSTYNAYLANSIGNLLSRILSLGQHVKDHRLRRIRKHSTKIFKAIFSAQTGKKLRTEEVDFKKETNERLIPSYTRAMNQSLPSAAMKEINDYATLCNQLIDKWKPWELAKDDSKCEQFDAVFYIVSEALRNIAILISPVLPRAAHGIFDQLNWKMESSGKEERFRLDDAKWGGLPDGHVVGKPTPLFPRIEV